MGTIRILEPVAERAVVAQEGLRELESLEGAVIGLISNEWRCVKIMHRHLERVLSERFGVKAIFKEVVEASLAAPQGLLDRVGEIKLPTLAICGTEDVMTPPVYSRYLEEHMDSCRTVIVEGATHSIMLERPDLVNRAIEDFLASLS
ncbi:MAG: alpha/beta hydrolase [Chloroflexi bacterium]|nr:alpha/beta hydrolase [Chloroflexota bacterium]